MSAYIVVVDTPYFALTAGGRAELSGLPEGRYDVRVWYAGMRNEPLPQPVTPRRRRAQSLTFQIGNK